MSAVIGIIVMVVSAVVANFCSRIARMRRNVAPAWSITPLGEHLVVIGFMTSVGLFCMGLMAFFGGFNSIAG